LRYHLPILFLTMTKTSDWSHASHLKDWFGRRASGCIFVSKLVNQERTLLAEMGQGLDKEDFNTIDQTVEVAALAGRAVVIFWPSACRASDAVELLRLLEQLPRWKVERVGWGGEQEACESFSVRWTTVSGVQTEVAGFAPFLEMPLTRRAPYLALALWGGTVEDASDIGLVQTPGPWVGDPRSDKMWAQSVALTGRMLTKEDRGRLRRVAFRLPAGLLSSSLTPSVRGAPSAPVPRQADDQK
jgi:hypothetical protein